MNDFESGRSSWRDQELDALLYDFFRDELPVELRDLPLRAETPFTTMSSPKRREQTVLALVFGLTAVAATLLVAASALWSPSANRAGPTPHGVVRHTTTSPAEESWHEFSLSPLESQVIERYDTASGPVEQRTSLRWINVSVFQPESGTEVEVMIPEVNIEVFEIKDE